MENKRNLLKFLPVGIGALAGAFTITIAMNVNAELATAIGSDVTARELRAITVESWDRDYTARGYGWEVYTNLDETDPVLESNDYKPSWSGGQVERHVKLIKGTPQDVRENMDYDLAHILGVKFGFTFPGYNVVTLKPPTRIDHYTVERPRTYLNDLALTGKGKAQLPCYNERALSMVDETSAQTRPMVIECLHGIELPGVVSAISVWVNGRGDDYALEGWIEDWKGDTHILNFGSMNFVGWRPMTAKIPTRIPQDMTSYPQVKNLVFKKFKIRSNPRTSNDMTYFFFDELKVLTDVFDVHFDGAQIDFDTRDCLRKQRAINLMRANARNPEEFPKPKDCSTAPGPVKPIPAIIPKSGAAKSAQGGGGAPPARGGGGAATPPPGGVP